MGRDAEAAGGDVVEAAEEVERGLGGGEFAGCAAEFVFLDGDAVESFDHFATFGTAADLAFDFVVGFTDGGAGGFVRCW